MGTNVFDFNRKRPALEASFDSFWKMYPLKKGKMKARALFDKITSEDGYHTKSLDKDSGSYIDLHLKATPEELVEAAKRFFISLPKKESGSYAPSLDYCPHATTWLNQGRWEDYQ